MNYLDYKFKALKAAGVSLHVEHTSGSIEVPNTEVEMLAEPCPALGVVAALGVGDAALKVDALVVDSFSGNTGIKVKECFEAAASTHQAFSIENSLPVALKVSCRARDYLYYNIYVGSQVYERITAKANNFIASEVRAVAFNFGSKLTVKSSSAIAKNTRASGAAKCTLSAALTQVENESRGARSEDKVEVKTEATLAITPLMRPIGLPIKTAIKVAVRLMEQARLRDYDGYTLRELSGKTLSEMQFAK